MPSQHFTTQQTRELKREIVELKKFITALETSTIDIGSFNEPNIIPRLIKYLELRRATIEQELARREAK